MSVLFIDTCNLPCLVALVDSDSTHVESRVNLHYQQQGEKILPLIEELLAQSKISLPQLSAIAVTQGPGSFTGIRIGIGVAKALSYALNKPLYAFSALQCLAQWGLCQQPTHTDMWVAQNAQMQEVYWAHYQCDKNALMRLDGEESLKPISQLAELATLPGGKIGSGWCEPAAMVNLPGVECHVASTFSDDHDNSRHQYLTALHQLIAGAQAGKLNVIADSLSLEPIYLRDNVVQSRATTQTK